jgi:hypothetical protein
MFICFLRVSAVRIQERTPKPRNRSNASTQTAIPARVVFTIIHSVLSSKEPQDVGICGKRRHHRIRLWQCCAFVERVSGFDVIYQQYDDCVSAICTEESYSPSLRLHKVTLIPSP